MPGPPIRYPQAIFDQAEQRWISDAEVAEIPFTAFRSHRHRPEDQVSGRLIVRRVRRLNPRRDTGQDELFPGYRHHAIFTDSPLPMLQAEAQHRGHAVIEQVFANLKAGPLAHLPPGHFPANSAWLVLAAMAFNLTRAAGALASLRHAKATTSAIRRQLIIPSRAACTPRPPTSATSAQPLAPAASPATAVHQHLRTTHAPSPLSHPAVTARPRKQL